MCQHGCCERTVAGRVSYLKQNRSCTCSLAWKLHRYDIGSDGSVVRKIEGAVGRIDYHVVVSVPHDIGFMHYDLGHVYHATDWKQNTYHPTGPLLPCTRALVVPGHDVLQQALRTAVAASWLALSKHDNGRHFCVLSRNQRHPDDVSCALPAAEASAGTNPCEWSFPPMPGTEASEVTRNAVQSIIRQCKLVCSKSAGKEEKMKMFRR